jgi:hypothetical protein
MDMAWGWDEPPGGRPRAHRLRRHGGRMGMGLVAWRGRQTTITCCSCGSGGWLVHVAWAPGAVFEAGGCEMLTVQGLGSLLSG